MTPTGKAERITTFAANVANAFEDWLKQNPRSLPSAKLLWLETYLRGELKDFAESESSLARKEEREAPAPDCKFQIGQKVYWQGQYAECSGVVKRITKPENSDYVLHIDVGFDEEFPMGVNEVRVAHGVAEPTLQDKCAECGLTAEQHDDPKQFIARVAATAQTANQEEKR